MATPGITKKGELAFAPRLVLAEWTGLEPATPGVTGRYSNQLNYHSLILQAAGAARETASAFVVYLRMPAAGGC